jgi:DNA-binding response OmpR family regulator
MWNKEVISGVSVSLTSILGGNVLELPDIHRGNAHPLLALRNMPLSESEIRMAKILIVEDDVALASVTKKWLELSRHFIEQVHTGAEGLALLKHYDFDAVILDIGLPDMNGIQVLKEFRSCGGKVPILVLTAKDTILDKEVGYEAGADDYLTKPFDLRELSLRLGALMRRPHILKSALLTCGSISLDTAAGKVFKSGRELELLPTEYALLEFFLRFPNHIFSVDDLLNHVWKSNSAATSIGVRTYITRLRKKISEDGKPSMLKTVHGQGYRLESETR